MVAETKFKWYGPQVQAKVHVALGEALFDAAEFVLEEANRTVPLDQGPLMDSGSADVDKTALKASVSYDTPYAVRQHEETTYRHAPGRRAKWLESTMKEQAPAIAAYLRNGAQRGL